MLSRFIHNAEANREAGIGIKKTSSTHRIVKFHALSFQERRKLNLLRL